MSIALILLQQIVIMFVLVAVGYLMFHFKKISMDGAKTLANILLYLSLPCVIIKGFFVDRSAANTRALLISAAMAAIILLASILVSRIFFKKDGVANFASAFSNPGFFGIPLITACISEGAVFYIAAFIAFLNILQWTYGVSVMTGKKGALSAKKVLTAPFMIAIIIGLIFYFSGVTPPTLISQCVVFLANLNTPVAMFTIGIYFAQVNIKKMLAKRSLYTVSLVRLVIVPFVSLAILSLLPSGLIDLKTAILIAAACPVGSNVAVYAQLHDKDYPYAVETVVLSTLLSLVSMPPIISLANMIW